MRGQVPLVRKTRPLPSGNRTKYGRVLSGSGLRTMSNSMPRSCPIGPPMIRRAGANMADLGRFEAAMFPFSMSTMCREM